MYLVTRTSFGNPLFPVLGLRQSGSSSDSTEGFARRAESTSLVRHVRRDSYSSFGLDSNLRQVGRRARHCVMR